MGSFRILLPNLSQSNPVRVSLGLTRFPRVEVRMLSFPKPHFSIAVISNGVFPGNGAVVDPQLRATSWSTWDIPSPFFIPYQKMRVIKEKTSGKTKQAQGNPNYTSLGLLPLNTTAQPNISPLLAVRKSTCLLRISLL